MPRRLLKGLLVLAYDVVAGRLLHSVLTRLRITARNRQYVPVLIIQFQRIATVVVPWPTGFLAKQSVLHNGL